MQRLSKFTEQCGYITVVQNNSTTDYLELAYLQARSIKRTQSVKAYAVMIDVGTKTLITDKHREVFDYILDIPYDDAASEDEWKLANDWKVWCVTPFKETVKLDSDIMFTRDVGHWWDLMRTKEVCMATTIRDYRGDISSARAYRKLFDDNNLIDAYNGFTYFRYSKTSTEFYQMVKNIFENWPVFRDQILKNCRHEKPSTDEVYAIAAKMIGEERCYIPNTGIGFTHMKGAVNGMTINDVWTDKLYHQLNGVNLTAGFYRQHYPFHIFDKACASELSKLYE
tara:strand:- start:5843 stop:6688 length:846 start_codon:yes stop_codon:yes gene_type:complete